MKRILLCALSLGILLAITGCASESPVSEKQPLRIGWSPWPGYYPLVLAERLGYFENRGLNVQSVYYEYSADLVADYAAGKLDGALLRAFDVLPLNARQSRDLSPVILITDSATDGNAIVATTDITTPADLKGKTLAVAFDSYAEVLVHNMMDQYGLSPNDVTLVDLPPERVLKELGRTIDAGHTYEPFISQAVDAGHHVIFSGHESPGLLMDVLTMRKSVAQNRAEEVRAFIDVFLAAQEWWRQNQIQGANLIAEATGLRPEDVTTDGLRLFDREGNEQAFADPTAPDSLYRSLADSLQYLLETGTLSNRTDLSQLINASFLNP